MDQPGAVVQLRSPPDAKIRLFRSLFRGREDIYARRYENRRTGKSGYAPACGHEWVQGVCEKPRIKCGDCRHQRFLPVTDEVIRWHLSGQDETDREFVMGVYPMLSDESCFFLAIDLDKPQWQEDAQAVLETCRRLALPAAVERSRSGNGAHIWLFFQQAVSAALARRLGAAHLLTEAMERRPEIGLDAYDRFFPNQDTLPRGGFGSLIALPLQKQARLCGQSLFLDNGGRPYDDQWEFMSRIQKIDRRDVERLVVAAERRGRILAVRPVPSEESGPPVGNQKPMRRQSELKFLGHLPGQLELILRDQIYIAKQGLPAALCNRLTRLAAFQNPEFYQAQSMRLPTFGKPRIIACAEDRIQHLGLPRGCLNEVQELLTDLKIGCVMRDERCAGQPLDVQFCGELQAEQAIAARAMLAHETGVLSATTAFGKTVVAAWLTARRGVNTLVLVHRRQLLEQWVQRLSQFLNLPPENIGRFAGGKDDRNGALDVAVIQSLVRRSAGHDWLGEYGHLIVDECHHVSSQSFESVVRRSKARFITGLSATVERKDGHHPIIFMQCGPVRYRVDAKAQAAIRSFQHTVCVRPTDFRPAETTSLDPRIQLQELYEQLNFDDARNERICDDVLQAVREGRSPLVLTERNDHLDRLSARLTLAAEHLVVLRGGATNKVLRAIHNRLAGIPDEECRILLATGRYVGEGFDDARLDTLFLTLPVSWRGTIAQYVGRLHRRHHRKREVRVYDYADLNVPLLARMFDRRCRGYEAVGYQVQIPGNAAPGWPTDVPLPDDPQWKTDHAASIGRLTRDGVDAPLAKLFSDAAQEIPEDTEGCDRARSATEAFLWRRLETLPETAGRFRLNAKLPIPFDGAGQMEVDLLCAVARLAVELDGPQHLDSLDAYRRDRRKDLLLQQHGYFVLRFLAADIGQRLDMVLDAILRALIHQTRN